MGGGGGAGAGFAQKLGGRMTPVVMWLIVANAAMFVLWAFGNKPIWMIERVLLSPMQFFGALHLWQPLTAMFLETSGLAFFFSILAMWLFVPALEQHWGPRRFLFFFLSVGVLANLVAVTLAHFYQPRFFGGFNEATLAVVVAFGVLWSKQPVSFFGVLPMSARQLTLVIVGLSYIQLAIAGDWIMLVSTTVAILYTLLITSYRFSPARWLENWRTARLRKRYKVLTGGRNEPKQKWLN